MGNIIYSDRFAYEKRVISYPFVDLINKAITEKKDALEIQDPYESGKVRYMALVPIKEFGWSVIVEREKKAVLRSESGYFIQISVISLLCFLVIAFSLVYFRKEFIHRQTAELLNTEKEMREKERRYSSLLENVNLVAVGLDTNGNITFANPFLLKLTGYALEEILAKNWFDIFIPGKDKEDVKRVFKEVLSNELFPHYDNPILTKSGEERLIAWNNTILKDIHGQVLGTMSIGEDITERKRAEEELRESEGRYRTLVESAGDAGEGIILIQDTAEVETAIVFANQEVERLTGYTSKELKGRAWADLVHPRYQEAVRERIRRRLSGAVIKDIFEISIVSRGGAEVPIEVSGSLTEFRGKPTVVGYMRDITERKRAEEALRDSEEKFRTLFEGSRDAIYITTREGEFMDFNKSALDLFAYTREEFMKLKAQELYACPEDRPKFQQEIEKRGFVRDYEVKFCKKDGTEMDCLLTTTLWRSKDGKILGYHGIIRDITERKRAEEALRQVEENFRRSLDESPLGVRIVTTEGETVYANRAILEIYGYDSIEELRTTPIKKRYTPESYAEFQI